MNLVPACKTVSKAMDWRQEAQDGVFEQGDERLKQAQAVDAEAMGTRYIGREGG